MGSFGIEDGAAKGPSSKATTACTGTETWNGREWMNGNLAGGNGADGRRANGSMIGSEKQLVLDNGTQTMEQTIRG